MSEPQVALVENIMTALERNGQGKLIIDGHGAGSEGQANTSDNTIIKCP